ncbi:hypothetical protein FIBSPDRAFT_540462 [Athelia psychrophila]|uniref:Uncharacterized protein n=1 Tax=Athelia psychrophila TaxID=1759441 RepID=A0A166IX99_9AGAM|nr:hypothetical protein FIBSPDRAFT_540462 [Fibularhizoctonia sp. CBS 109695]
MCESTPQPAISSYAICHCIANARYHPQRARSASPSSNAPRPRPPLLRPPPRPATTGRSSRSRPPPRAGKPSPSTSTRSRSPPCRSRAASGRKTTSSPRSRRSPRCSASSRSRRSNHRAKERGKIRGRRGREVGETGRRGWGRATSTRTSASWARTRTDTTRVGTAGGRWRTLCASSRA